LIAWHPPKLSGGPVWRSTGVGCCAYSAFISAYTGALREAVGAVAVHARFVSELVWVIQPGGSQRAAEYVGVGETSAWFGGPPTVIVIYPETTTGEAVELDRVIPHDA
jgi:hypothetical protein